MARPGCGLRPRGRLRQDRPLELLQLWPWIEAELVRQIATGVLVGLERLALATIDIEGKHEQAPQPLAARLIPHEALQFGDGLPRHAGSDPQLEQLFQRLDAQLLETLGLSTSELFAGQVAQGGARPELQDRLQRRQRGLRSARCNVFTRLAEPTLEPSAVELVISHIEPVASRGSRESSAVGAKSLTDPRDVDLDGLDRSEGLLLWPHPVGQGLGRKWSVPLQQQEREHAPLASSTEIERMSIRECRDVPE